MAKMASVYRFPDRLVVHPSSFNRIGLWADSPPFEVIDVNAHPSALGEAVVAALAHSSDTLGSAGPPAVVARELAKAAGLKPRSSFDPRAFCLVEVDDDGSYEFSAMRRDGDGHSGIARAGTRLPPHSTVAAVGEAVAKSLASSGRGYRRA